MLSILLQGQDLILTILLHIKQLLMLSETDLLNHGMIPNNIIKAKIVREYIIFLWNS